MIAMAIQHQVCTRESIERNSWTAEDAGQRAEGAPRTQREYCPGTKDFVRAGVTIRASHLPEGEETWRPTAAGR